MSTKKNKIFDNIYKTTLEFMQGKGYVPLTQGELLKRLHLQEHHSEILKEVLLELIREGMIELKHGKYQGKKARQEVVKGVLKLHPRGFGFVKLEDPSLYGEDIFIPKHSTYYAVDGDTVEVVVSDVLSEKGPEGKIVTILNRGRTHLAGIVREISRKGDYNAYVPMLGSAHMVIVETPRDEILKVGDRIVMEVSEWGTKETATYCKFSHYLGHISDPSKDVVAAVEEFGLRGNFPAEVVAQAQEFSPQVPLKEIKKREDLRHLECFTIDPDTAKDFDDALSLSKDSKGHFHLGVHIADVSHYVSKGSPLDKEAELRCNSTYFPATCLPMLPPELSNNLCSLKPKVNRLTASVLIEFDPQGEVIQYRITRSVIKSAKRFTYREAKEVLDGKKKSPHAPTLQLMVEMCKLLKIKRYERGSIEFGIPELVVLVDEHGIPQKTDYVVYDITHQLVEEFMLKANEIVATHLTKLGKSLTYRVHDEPSEENLKDFSLLANAFGFKLSEKPTPKEIQELFDEAMETSYGQYLATSYIRRMRLAIYSPDNIGHYGLSLTHYCHFTSPIRRYVDLVVHRILFHEEDTKESLEAIALRCSEQERISAKAETSVVVLKKLRLLTQMQKKDPYRTYEAVITRIKSFGITFEVIHLMLESYLHVSELEDDYYNFDEKNMCLIGRNDGKVYRTGDKIEVILKEVDLITQEAKWSLVGESKERERGKRRRQKQRKKSRRRR